MTKQQQHQLCSYFPPSLSSCDTPTAWTWVFSLELGVLSRTMTCFSPKEVNKVGLLFWSHAKLLQSCPTLCDPRDGSLPGSPVPGILQARTLEWVAISFSNAWKWKVKVKSLSHVQLFATPWTAAYQAPPPMGFSRQEYWSGVPLPSPSEVIGTHNEVIPPLINFSFLAWLLSSPVPHWATSPRTAPLSTCLFHIDSPHSAHS